MQMFVDFGLTSGIIFLGFRLLFRSPGNRRSSLPDRRCYPDKFNHSHQITQSEKIDVDYCTGVGVESQIASFSKFAAVWYRRASSLEITVRKLLCSVVIQTFLFDMYFNW